LAPADELFSNLLAAQAREAATRQSVDRLSGWSKTIEARFQIQNAPALDRDMIRFVEAKASAESARYSAERQRLAGQANALLGRPAEAPLVAVLQLGSGPAPAGAAASDSAAALARLESEVLPQGQELLAKLYQSYLFGGVPLTTLLSHEQRLYAADLDYRLWAAAEAFEAERRSASPAPAAH
jgi:hypothetical protein